MQQGGKRAGRSQIEFSDRLLMAHRRRSLSPRTGQREKRHVDLALTIVLWTAAALFVMAGTIGLVLPVLPGPVLLFVGLVLGAWAEGFRHVGWLPLCLLAAMMTGALIIDQLAAAFGVRRVGASQAAAVGAVIGAILGILGGLPGILLGPFVGGFLGELYAKKQARIRRSRRSGGLDGVFSGNRSQGRHRRYNDGDVYSVPSILKRRGVSPLAPHREPRTLG